MTNIAPCILINIEDTIHGPTGLFKPPIPMVSRCTNLGTARTAPPCAIMPCTLDAFAMHKFGHRQGGSTMRMYSSRNDQRRKRVIAMIYQGIGTSRKYPMHVLKWSPEPSVIYRRAARSSAKQLANIRWGTPRLRMSPTHDQRHIGDVSNMLL